MCSAYIVLCSPLEEPFVIWFMLRSWVASYVCSYMYALGLLNSQFDWLVCYVLYSACFRVIDIVCSIFTSHVVMWRAARDVLVSWRLGSSTGHWPERFSLYRTDALVLRCGILSETKYCYVTFVRWELYTAYCHFLFHVLAAVYVLNVYNIYIYIYICIAYIDWLPICTQLPHGAPLVWGICPPKHLMANSELRVLGNTWCSVPLGTRPEGSRSDG